MIPDKFQRTLTRKENLANPKSLQMHGELNRGKKW